MNAPRGLGVAERNARLAACCVTLVLMHVAVASAEVRTWTDLRGRKMQAEFVRLDGDTVVFLKGGAEFKYALRQLSPADQVAITQLAVLAASQSAGLPTNPFEGVGSPSTSPSAPSASSGGMTSEGSVEAEQKLEPLKSNRTWQSKTRSATGRYVRIHDGSVVLRVGNRVVMIPFHDLSDADQEFLKAHMDRLGTPQLIPDPPPPPAAMGNGGAGGLANNGGRSPMGFPRGFGGGMSGSGGGMSGSGADRGESEMGGMMGSGSGMNMGGLAGMAGRPSGGSSSPRFPTPTIPKPRFPTRPSFGGSSSMGSGMSGSGMSGSGSIERDDFAGGMSGSGADGEGAMEMESGGMGMGAGAPQVASNFPRTTPPRTTFPGSSGMGGMSGSGSGGSGMGMSGSGADTDIPSFPSSGSSFPTQTVQMGQCSSCKAVISESEARGKSRCPRCGIRWRNRGGSGSSISAYKAGQITGVIFMIVMIGAVAYRFIN